MESPTKISLHEVYAIKNGPQIHRKIGEWDARTGIDIYVPGIWERRSDMEVGNKAWRFELKQVSLEHISVAKRNRCKDGVPEKFPAHNILTCMLNMYVLIDIK